MAGTLKAWARVTAVRQLQLYWQVRRTGTETLFGNRHMSDCEVGPNRTQSRAVNTRSTSFWVLLCEYFCVRAIATPCLPSHVWRFSNKPKEGGMHGKLVGHILLFAFLPTKRLSSLAWKICLGICTCVQPIQSALLFLQACTLWCIDRIRCLNAS